MTGRYVTISVPILFTYIINPMFKVFTKPKKVTNSYKEACQIASANYDKTGEHVAVEHLDDSNVISFPSDH